MVILPNLHFDLLLFVFLYMDVVPACAANVPYECST